MRFLLCANGFGRRTAESSRRSRVVLGGGNVDLDDAAWLPVEDGDSGAAVAEGPGRDGVRTPSRCRQAGHRHGLWDGL